MKKVLLAGVILSAIAITSLFAQPNWKRVNYETSTVFTGIVNINGSNATTNDYIGVFVNGECRMVSKVIIVNDTSFVSAVIHSSGKPETAVIKYWDSQTNTSYDIDTVVTIGDHETVKRFPITLKSDEVVEEPSQIITQKEDKFEVFPAPFTNTINIESSKEIKTVTVFNNIGKLMKSNKNVYATSLSLQTANYVTGLYLISVEFVDGTVITKKIFKKN